MTNVSGQYCGVASEVTLNAIYRLEVMEETTLNDWQREAVALLVQDERRVVELRMPRRAGKSWLIRKLMNRVSNSTHMVFPTRRHADIAIGCGIPEGRVHYYGNLITLHEVDVPEIILCDECVPDDFIMNVGAQKILSLYTPYPNMPGRDTDSTESTEEMGSTTIEDLERWRQEWEIVEPIEKEWDDARN
jgi:hypothetical protein